MLCMVFAVGIGFFFFHGMIWGLYFIFFERLGLIVCACWYLLASSMFSSTSMSSFVISFVSLDCSRFFPNLSLERLCSLSAEMRSVHFVAGVHVAGSTNVSVFRSSSSLLLILVFVCVCVYVVCHPHGLTGTIVVFFLRECRFLLL